MPDPSPNSPRPSRRAGPERSRRGGPRPGSGAPKGNLNALKHGMYSRRFAALGAVLARSPAARAELLRLGEKHEARGHKADEVAAHLISEILSRGLRRGRDRLILMPPVHDSDSTKKIEKAPVQNPRKKSFGHEHNQTPDSK